MFEGPPTLEQMKKQGYCEHGNPKDLCEICGGKKELFTSGWRTNKSLAKEFNVGQGTIQKIAMKHRDSNPEFFNEKPDAVGTPRDHYSSELVEIIKEEVNAVMKWQDGWKRYSELIGPSGFKRQAVQRIADGYREFNPEFFREMRGADNKKREYYSPELVEIILNQQKSLKKKEEGWKTNGGLSDELGVDNETIKRIAKKYRITNPDYFEILKESQKKPLEYYSPELVEEIIKQLSRYKEKKDDWLTNRELAEKLHLGPVTIKKIADQYRDSNPEFFVEMKSGSGALRTHYSPELAEIIKEKLSQSEQAPDGWKTQNMLMERFNVSAIVIKKIVDIYRNSNPEYFKKYKIERGQLREHYAPELVEIINNEFTKFEQAPDNWKTSNAVAKEFDGQRDMIRKIAEEYRQSNPEYFKHFRTSEGMVREHFSPDLVEIIRLKINAIEKVPNGWKTSNAIAEELKASSLTVQKIAEEYRQSNPEYFKKYIGEIYERYSPELVEIVRKEWLKFELAPLEWKTNGALAVEFDKANQTIKKIAEKYRQSNPEYFKEYKIGEGQIYEHYSPELVGFIRAELTKFELAPDGWKSRGFLAGELGVTSFRIDGIVNNYRKANPEYFKKYIVEGGRACETYSPILVEIIKKELEGINVEKEQSKEEEILKEDLENFIQEISNEETQDEKAKKIREIISLLPENACDILFKYHPKYKGLSVGYVKSVIADYLGDFLTVRRPWKPKDMETAKDLLDDENYQKAILMKFKEASFAYMLEQRRMRPEVGERELLREYFEQENMLEVAVRIPEMQQMVDDLKDYYNGLFKMAENKPNNIVHSLKEGRVFPDINQLINIKEIADNKKMLIADEMGLGKSASAVLAKEYLGLKCGLLVVPKNVINTWERYLSDKKDEKGKQVGYFKPGLAPKVLIIDSPKKLKELKNGAVFDYVLISQERIAGDKYVEALEKVDFDMMIIDEVHKLKNIEDGVRSENVIRLSEKIQGGDKYLAMLSGTPMPNKVKDLAIILKLLYPEKYKDYEDRELVNRIIYGDLIDLREELFSRMQMKELKTSIEMPPLFEEDVKIELSVEEKEVYQILLEEDELTASQKIIIFRQFLLNPQILGVEPGFEGSKVKKIKETLVEDLKKKDKIVVFVNGYIEGVIRGENNIVDAIIAEKILPEGTDVRLIHGEITDEKERAAIEKELKESDEKMVVFVSGQTADVGVDFSGADEMIFYNDPWSKYEKRQQQGRCYREGLKGPLTVKTLLATGTIEEGIRRYINAKEKAIEKLLRGLARTDAENKLLEKDSRSKKNDVETNEDLSREYMNDWERLMLHFGEGWEAGNEWFKDMSEEKRESYAQLYKHLGGLTYQGNNARVSASLIEKMISEREGDDVPKRILDIASGPEMLKRHSSGRHNNAIYSLDINEKHFEEAVDKRRTFKSSYLNLPVRSGSTDYYNMGFAFHQTKAIKTYKKNYERLAVLAEMNRVLKVGGRAVISEVHNIEFVHAKKFEELVKSLGFKMIKEYSGEANGGENYRAHFITLEKIEEISGIEEDAAQSTKSISRINVQKLGENLGRELLSGLEIRKLKKGDSRLGDQRRMVDVFELGGKRIEIAFNEADGKLFEQEKKAIEEGEALMEKHGGIKSIPLSEIKRIGFERRMNTPGYYLLYKIIIGGGAIVLRGDYKEKKKTKSESEKQDADA